MANVFAVIPAAGTGSRMGTEVKKQYLELCGLPLLAHTLALFAECPVIHGIVLVVGKEEVLWCQENIVGKYCPQKMLAVISGGDYRQQSVYNGLIALKAADDDIVVVHDGVRPLLTADILLNIIAVAKEKGNAVAAVPVKDTIKVADANRRVLSTPPRENLWAAQTPQAFKFATLIKAYEHAERCNFIGTDDASLVERLGIPVNLVAGSYENIKITTPEDLLLAEAILKRRGAYCG